MSLTVLLGGARSGKSSLAVDIGRRHRGPVTFIATAPPIDDDMIDRIARHREDRPAHWNTVEATVDLVGAMREAGDSLVIVDCLTLWTSNLMLAGHGGAEIRALAAEAAESAAARTAPVVAVSNEVGMGVHPETELGRTYRDLLGAVNQCWVAAADTSLLLVAGQAIELTDPLTHLID